MRGLPPTLRRSMTFDNGKEFAEHEKFAQACDLEVYFAFPYCSVTVHSLEPHVGEN
jgi:IS30 family transposase